MWCQLVCKREFQTIKVPDNSCMVQTIPGKMVSLEVKGQFSPVKDCTILKMIRMFQFYWHAALPLDPTSLPTLDKGQLASLHLAPPANAFFKKFSQLPNKYGNLESIIMRVLHWMSTAPAKYAFPLHSVIFPCAIVRAVIFSHHMILPFSFRWEVNIFSSSRAGMINVNLTLGRPRYLSTYKLILMALPCQVLYALHRKNNYCETFFYKHNIFPLSCGYNVL